MTAIAKTKRNAGERAGVPPEELAKLPAKQQNTIARGGGYQLVELTKIVRSPFNRETFEPEKMKELIESVREHGVLEPVLVRTQGPYVGLTVELEKPKTHSDWLLISHLGIVGVDEFKIVARFDYSQRDEAFARLETLREPHYELIAGERRWRAACEVGLTHIPAIVHSLDDRTTIVWQITENLDREDIGPLDEARAYKRLLDLGTTMEELEQQVKRKRSTIYARLALLNLPDEARAACEDGRLPASHAELLGKVDDPAAQARLAKSMLDAKETYRGGQMVKPESVSFREAKVMADEAVRELEVERKWQIEAADYAAKGCKVMTRAQSASVFNYGSLKAGYVGVGDKCDLDPQGRTWKSLLGTHAPQAIVAKGGYNPTLRVLYARTAAEKALKLAGHAFAKVSTAEKVRAKKSSEETEKKRREEKEARQKAESGEIIGRIVTVAESREFNADMLRLIVMKLTERGGSGAMLERRGIKCGEGWDAKRKAMMALIAKADGKTLRGICVETLLWDYDHADNTAVQSAAKVFGVKVQTPGKRKG
ncbi:MAG: ParB/RepB/Spo0J family partition protein [Chthoniobacteraceae bacterium]